MSGPSYVRMYPTDWRSGCLGLSLEQEGLYIRMCMFIAETGQRVPLDDSQAAKMIGTNVNQYRKVLGQLLVLGKVKRHEDGYGNDRIEHETTSAKSASSSGNGSGRKADQGQERQAGEATPQVTHLDATPATHPVTHPVQAEKEQQFQRPFIEPEPRTKNQEPFVGQTDNGLKDAFNGSTAAMLTDIQKWMGPHGTPESAAKWLGTMLTANGQTATAQAYQMLTAGLAQNTPIARPIQYWSKTAANLKANQQSPRPLSKSLTERAAERRAKRQAEEAAHG